MKLVSEINTQPVMGAAFAGWTSPLVFFKIAEEILDGVVKETQYVIRCAGVIQPLEPRKLYLKPEGQRAWTWLQMHVTGSQAVLATNDKIEYQGTRYKVMAVLDYSQNNYSEYHIIRDFEGTI